MQTSNSVVRRRRRSGGFTLAEVAVTIVIVGIALVLLLQGLGGSKAQAYFTRNLKLANQLARETLGEVASGLYREDAEFGLAGTYADRGYPEFSYEVYIGEDNFPAGDSSGDRAFNSWEHQREMEERQRDRERDSSTERPSSEQTADDAKAEEHDPYEKVRIVVVFPVIGPYENQYQATEWIPWEQVYGEDEEDEASAGSGAGAGAGGNSSNSGSGSGGSRSGSSGGVRQG